MSCTGYITGTIRRITRHSNHDGESALVSLSCSYRIFDDANTSYTVKSMYMTMMAYDAEASELFRIGTGKRVAVTVRFDFKPYRIDRTDLMGTYANATVLTVDELLPFGMQPHGMRYDKNEVWLTGTVMRVPRVIEQRSGRRTIRAISFPVLSDKPMHDDMSTRYQNAPMIVDCVLMTGDAGRTSASIDTMAQVSCVGHLQMVTVDAKNGADETIRYSHPVLAIDSLDVTAHRNGRWYASVMLNDTDHKR